MKSAETLLACCVVGLACFVGDQVLTARPVRAEADGAIDVRSARVSRSGASRASGPSARPGPARPAPRGERPDPAELRRRIAVGHDSTYIAELLVARDSVIARWPERDRRPLRVFVSEGERLDGWNYDFVPAVRDAFATWTLAGIPVRFAFTADSASADIRVRFLERFPNGISGKTIWSRDGNYWLVSSEIQLALQHPSGGIVTPPQMRAIALHEVGHLIGLDHTADPEHIMSPRVRARELSEMDKATARLLYSVPAGSLK